MSDQSLDSNPLKDRRRWWVALLMLFPTGAGYIYVGRPMRFVGFTVFVLLSLAVLYSGVWGWVDQAMVYGVISVVAIGFAIDIVMIAITQNSHDLRWPQRRKWYVASLVLWTALAFAPGVAASVVNNVVISLEKLAE